MFDLIPFGAREKSIWNYFDNLEKTFFQNGTFGQIRTDIMDEGDKYVLNAELPGFDKNDIQIDIENDFLQIRASKNEETEDKRDNYVRRERRSGSYARGFDISGINADAISAKYENGILTLDLPKRESAPLPPSRQIAIQ